MRSLRGHRGESAQWWARHTVAEPCRCALLRVHCGCRLRVVCAHARPRCRREVVRSFDSASGDQPSTLPACDGELHDVGDAGNRPTLPRPERSVGRTSLVPGEGVRDRPVVRHTTYSVTVAIHDGEGVARALPLRRVG